MALSWTNLAQEGAPAPVLTSAIPAFTFPGAAAIVGAQASIGGAATSAQVFDDCDDDEDDDELINSLMNKFDCDAVRRKIQRFLARKTMTQTAFLREISVNGNSYYKFMGYKGKYTGSNNGTYERALLFFHKLEKKEGVSASAKKKSPADKALAAGEPKKLSRKDQAAKAQELFDKINAMKLEEPVYVYDDCDDIRKKINELIESKMVTQAALLKELSVNSNSLRRFLTSKGKREGSSNGVYESAYIFFEKLRIAEGKPKTKKRTKNEETLRGGYSLERDPTHSWSLSA